MERRQIGERFQPPRDGIGDTHRGGELGPSVNDPVPHGVDRARLSQCARQIARLHASTRSRQIELRFLGIGSSPAFFREPEGNGCAERFIRTLNEQILWIERCDSVEALRQG